MRVQLCSINVFEKPFDHYKPVEVPDQFEYHKPNKIKAVNWPDICATQYYADRLNNLL
jgi:hypothetical protein